MNISGFLIKLFRIFIEECEFIDNQSDYDSNCITFEGFNLTMTSKYRENSQFISFYHLDVRMINNSPLNYFEKDPTWLKMGSALTHKGEQLFLTSSFFQGNYGKYGGALFFESGGHSSQIVQIKNNYFKENFAYCGGAMSFYGSFFQFYAFITENFFYKNWAICNFITFLLPFNYFLLIFS